MKKILALVLTMVMVLSLAACGSNNNAKDTDPKASSDATQAPAGTDNAGTEQVNLSLSWWGGDTRHDATMKAVDKFMETYPNIKVTYTYDAWTGWEDKMSTSFYANTAPDVNQINWNWITSFSSDGSKFLDLNTVSDTLDLTQFDQAALEQCTVSGELQAVPVSMTGRIFFWNKATFDKAGISVPTTFAELKAAAATFQEKLGADYYPLVVGEYDRFILMVYYLESVYGKAWVENNTLNYTKEEIQKGYEWIQSLEADKIIPSIETILGDGAESIDKNPNFADGHYAGIFEWDTGAPKYDSILKESGGELVVGNFFKDLGEFQGGFAKVSLGFAISETCKNPKEAAMLVNFLLNEEAGVELMASERGVPLSKKALQVVTDKGLVNPIVGEANKRVLEWVQFPLDPFFEDAKLKANPTGAYVDTMAGLSYGDYDAATAADMVTTTINEVLGQ